jgi:DNA-binding NtrC family response regulator
LTPIDSTALSGAFVEVRGGQLAAASRDTGLPVEHFVAIGADPCVVGRGASCQVVVDDAEVSTCHCELTATSGGVRVRDLHSRNGTFVHAARLEPGGSLYLTADARLRVGQSWFVVRVTGTEELQLSRAGHFGPLIGRSAAMRRIYAQLGKIAPHEVSVLITGETGTGKELVAQAIHEASRRASGPFVIVDCTNIPASLAESTLFGHEKGAFTGAVSRRISPFVEAAGGTIFFDELGELPYDLQAKLLRAIEARQVQSVGSTRYQDVDVRIVAATRRNLLSEINEKRFREDLYYRIAQTVVWVPPLRERPDDIPDLITLFLEDLGDPGAIGRIDRPVRDRLMRHDWPGNVRELRNVMAAALAHSNGGPFEVADLLAPDGGRPLLLQAGPGAAQPWSEQIEKFEREFFATLHRETGGNLSEMARRSGLARSTVRRYLTRYGLGVCE